MNKWLNRNYNLKKKLFCHFTTMGQKYHAVEITLLITIVSFNNRYFDKFY